MQMIIKLAISASWSQTLFTIITHTGQAMWHWGVFVQTLSQWKRSKYCIFWVCVCSLSYQHAMHMRHAVICGLPHSAVFFHIISQRARLKKNLLNILKRVSPLSTGILYGRLQRVTLPEAVIMQFVLLKMSKVLLETCWGL